MLGASQLISLKILLVDGAAFFPPLTITTPGLPEAIWFKLRCHADVVQHGRNSAVRLQQALISSLETTGIAKT